MISQQSVALDNKKNATIKKLHFFIMCNNILDNCVKKYIKETHNYYIPYDFITFYFDECQKRMITDEYLSTFFLCFNNKIVDIDNIITVYSKSKLPNLSSKELTKDSLLKGLKAGKYLISDKHSSRKDLQYTIDSQELDGAITQLNIIINDVNQTKNLVKSKYTIYRKQYNKNNISKINEKAEDQKLHRHKPLNSDKKAIAPPSQGKVERVAKLIIPKIRVIGMYPKSQSLSRVDSRYFAYTFTTPANQVRLVNIYHLKKVGLKKGFVDKRDQVMKSGTKKSKFDDLF